MHQKRWSVEIFVDDDDGRSYAEARLHTHEGQPIIGRGRARVNPADEDIPEIGDELAVARALTDLGHRLLVTSSRDISAVTAEEVQLTQ